MKERRWGGQHSKEGEVEGKKGLGGEGVCESNNQQEKLLKERREM